MADAKLSALTELAAAPAVGDEIYIRDISEAASAESKRITVANLILAAAVSAIKNATENELVTIGSTVTELEAEANLTFDGTTLTLGGGQLAFPATQAPSSNANTLDDFQEVAFTPAIADASLNASEATQGIQDAFSVKIGDEIYFRLRVSITALNTLAGATNVMGLPVASSSSAPHSNVFVSWAAGLAITGGFNMGGIIEPGNSHISLYLWDATGGPTTMAPSEISDDGQFSISGWYRI